MNHYRQTDALALSKSQTPESTKGIAATLVTSLLLAVAFSAHAQGCFPWTATVSSGESWIQGYSADEVCKKLVNLRNPQIVNGGAHIIYKTYTGLQASGPTGYYCKFDRRAVWLSPPENAGQPYPPETGPWAMDGTVPTGCTTCKANDRWIPEVKQCWPVVPRERDLPLSCEGPRGGNPVFPLTGTKSQSEHLGQWLGESFELAYDTRQKIASTQPANRVSLEPSPGFGELWQASFLKRLVVQRSFDETIRGVQAVRGRHRTISFSSNDAGELLADAQVADRLVLVGAEWRYADQSARAIERYAADGRLLRVDYSDGRSLELLYSTSSTPEEIAPVADLLIEMRDQMGRTVRPAYRRLDDGSVRIDRITDPSGAVTSFVFDALGRLTGVVWPDGKHREFLYRDPGQTVWTKVAEEGGAFVVPAYQKVRYGQGSRWLERMLNGSFTCGVATFGSDPYPGVLKQCERLDTIGLTWALTGIIDENLSPYSTYAYSPDGTALSTELANGVGKYSLGYSTPPKWAVFETIDFERKLVWQDRNWTPPSQPAMTGPTGFTTQYSVESIRGGNRVASQSQPAGSGCAASTSNQTYDVNGNVASADDFNGTRSCHVHDLDRNFETVRVEGLSSTQACAGVTGIGVTLPAGSRKVSSQWHPDWRLATKTAEPGKLTTRVYNGQPDPFNGNAIASCAPSTALLPDGKPIVVLCKQVEQATTDADGSQGFSAGLQPGVATRETSWTYNQYGQVLTEDGPRTDINDVTTYSYYADTTADHTLGDLYRVTNAVGQFTEFTKYNKHGQVLEEIDPNGVVTTRTYDLRQRLTSVTVAGQTTGYTYDPVGQLTRVTQPDGSFVGYEYDAAHRQVASFDQLGNRIEYVLDNAGNRTAENVKDPSGALRKSLARSFDALNRVQQSTGLQ